VFERDILGAVSLRYQNVEYNIVILCRTQLMNSQIILNNSSSPLNISYEYPILILEYLTLVRCVLLLLLLTLDDLPQIIQAKLSLHENIKYCPPKERAQEPASLSKIPLPNPSTTLGPIYFPNNLFRINLRHNCIRITESLSLLEIWLNRHVKRIGREMEIIGTDWLWGEIGFHASSADVEYFDIERRHFNAERVGDGLNGCFGWIIGS
jgi:hypothetical protein